MLDFIIKYWLEVAFGLICGTLAWFIKKYLSLYKESKNNHETSIITTIQEKMDNQYDKTQEQMNQCYGKLDTKISEFIDESREEDKKMNERIGNMRNDVLTIEGAYFRAECRKLLKKEHIITQEEFNTITLEHDAYNNLGGNHEGDMLFEMVREKHRNQLLTKEE